MTLENKFTEYYKKSTDCHVYPNHWVIRSFLGVYQKINLDKSKYSKQSILDLGSAPPANAYRLKEDLQKPEMMYPLRIFVCDKCWLVQTEDFGDADELFNPEYAYFSSTSSSWLDHASRYSEMILKRLYKKCIL